MDQKSLQTVLTLGNFDGLHRGHQTLIEKTLALAKKESLSPMVMTFEPHPWKVLLPERGLKNIFEFDDKMKLFKSLGMDQVRVVPFSRDLSQLDPESFFKKIIIDEAHAKVLVVGYDFSFGKNRSGTLEVLKSLCSKYALELHVLEPLKIDDMVVSSSQIRKFILNGEMEKTQEFLGRPFFVKGLVLRGDGRGHSIGFPTANLFSKAELFPATGVYVSRFFWKDKAYPSVTNIGFNPTFQAESSGVKIETHIFDFSMDLYGSRVKVEILSRIRSEKKFSHVDELKKQIQADIVTAREYHAKY